MKILHTVATLPRASMHFEMGSLERSRFESFQRADIEYSRVGDVPLIASVLIPKKAQEEPQRQAPVLVFWHGGGFVVGGRLYEPWWSDWLVAWSLPSHDDISDCSPG